MFNFDALKDCLILVFGGYTIYFNLRQRKRVLSSVVYNRQIEACYELIEGFAELQVAIRKWNDLRQREIMNFYNDDLETNKKYSNQIHTIQKYSLILPNKLNDGIIRSFEFVKQQIDIMRTNPGHQFDLNAFSDQLGDLYSTMRITFGIEKLSKANKSILENFEKVSDS